MKNNVSKELSQGILDTSEDFHAQEILNEIFAARESSAFLDTNQFEPESEDDDELLKDIITQLREELSAVKHDNSQLREELNRLKAIQANSEQSLDIIQETQQQKLPEVDQASTVNEGIFEIDMSVAAATANTSVPVTNYNLSRSTSPNQLERLLDESVQHADANNEESVVLRSEVIRFNASSTQDQHIVAIVANRRRPILKLRDVAKETKLCSQVSVNLDNINEDGVINDDCNDKEDSDSVVGKDEGDFTATNMSVTKRNIRANGFTKKAHAMKHIRVHNGKRYACDVKNCNSVYKTIDGLKHHAGLKPFSCNECNRSFKKKSDLSRHMLIHSGETPFFCEVCETSFRRKHHLSNHLNIHTGDKPHSCEVCNKSFRQKSALSRHSRIHTGEKPYVCTVCNASFRYKSSLSLHSKKCVGKNHVKEQLLVCD